MPSSVPASELLKRPGLKNKRPRTAFSTYLEENRGKKRKRHYFRRQAPFCVELKKEQVTPVGEHGGGCASHRPGELAFLALSLSLSDQARLQVDTLSVGLG